MSATTKTKKVQALRQKQKVFRSENPLVTVVSWGVHRSVMEQEDIPIQPLLVQSDFKAFSKVSIENDAYNREVLPPKFKIKEYCPLVFRDVRLRSGETAAQYIGSLCGGACDAVATPGHRDATVYATPDRRLLIRHVSKEEVARLLGMLQEYHAHGVQEDGTLLPLYYGLFRVTLKDRDPPNYLVILRNVLSCVHPIHCIYDLKGSTFQRSADERDREGPVPTLKDNDFTGAGEMIRLPTVHRATVLDRLANDVRLLSSLKVMDYRLVVGVYNFGADDGPVPVLDSAVDPYAAGVSSSAGKAYFIGIVDILSRYGAKKMAARTAKQFRHGSKAEISTVNPEKYSERFLRFAASVIVNEESVAEGAPPAGGS